MTLKVGTINEAVQPPASGNLMHILSDEAKLVLSEKVTKERVSLEVAKMWIEQLYEDVKVKANKKPEFLKHLPKLLANPSQFPDGSRMKKAAATSSNGRLIKQWITVHTRFIF